MPAHMRVGRTRARGRPRGDGLLCEPATVNVGEFPRELSLRLSGAKTASLSARVNAAEMDRRDFGRRRIVLRHGWNSSMKCGDVRCAFERRRFQ